MTTPNVPEDVSRSSTPIGLAPLGDRPLVSILIPTYNYGRFVTDAVDSALAQEFLGALEVLVCDDGSTDDTQTVLEKYRDDPRVTVSTQTNEGHAAALNTLVQVSGGEVVCLLDADDVFLPGKVERVLDMFRRSPSAGTAAHPLRPVDTLLDIIGNDEPASIPEGWLGPQAAAAGGRITMPPTSGLAFRREVLNSIMPIPNPDSLRHIGDGYMIGAAVLTAPVVATRSVFSLRRYHGKNIVAYGGLEADKLRQSVADYKNIFDAQAGYAAQNGFFLDAAQLTEMWETALGLYCLTGEEIAPRHEMIARSRRRYRWRLVTILPSPLRRAAIHAWWGRGGIRSKVSAFWRSITGAIDAEAARSAQ
jgi:glycosyltransferase involved in cell wall biosynthesis